MKRIDSSVPVRREAPENVQSADFVRPTTNLHLRGGRQGDPDMEMLGSQVVLLCILIHDLPPQS
jgi:hypothetical protein